MPELPEVETIKRGLEKKIVGLKIKSVKVLSAKNFIGDPQNIIGQKITAVDRRAKIIILKLEINFLLIHLKMTGQLLLNKHPDKYTRVIIEFNNQDKLYFNDLRKFGWMKVVKDLKSLKFGPEPLTKNFTQKYFKNLLGKSKKSIKLILMDQEKISGVGNIYANEALFLAGIDPARKASDLQDKEINSLYLSLKKVLQQGILFGGTSAKDESYRNLSGEKGQMQKHLRVYEKEGQQCFRCQGKIKKIKLGGRGTYYCPACQK